MKQLGNGVLQKSEIYFFSPSQTAKKLYYYPTCAGHFYCDKNYRLIRKNYDSLLIACILEGTFCYVKNGKHITAQAGDTVVLDCYQPHEYYTEDYMEFLWVHVSGLNCRELFTEIEKNTANSYHCSSEHIKQLLLPIFDAVRSDNPTSAPLLSLDIYKIFTQLLEPRCKSANNPGRYRDCIRETQEYIAAHLEDSRLHVRILADRAHMSTSHFSKVFKQQTGYAPYDYILLARLNRAKELLQKTGKSVAAIAYETGFNSESNFIYYFSASEGISPGKFRKLPF